MLVVVDVVVVVVVVVGLWTVKTSCSCAISARSESTCCVVSSHVVEHSLMKLCRHARTPSASLRSSHTSACSSALEDDTAAAEAAEGYGYGDVGARGDAGEWARAAEEEEEEEEEAEEEEEEEEEEEDAGGGKGDGGIALEK